MKIKRFIGTQVNGFLKFDLKFKSDLTFVTGINGTGKTSALNSMVALIFPRLDYLANASFQRLQLDIQDKKKLVKLIAIKDNDVTFLSCSLFKDKPLAIEKFKVPEDIPLHRAMEYEDDYYKELLNNSSKHPVIDFIENLPSPMYLGLERRSLSIDTDRARYMRRTAGSRNHHRNVFSRSIGQSLNEALSFAQTTFQENRRKEARLDAKVRESLILALIGFPPISLSSTPAPPSKKERKTFEAARKNLRRLPELLKISDQDISNNIDPLFNFLDEKLKIIDKTNVDNEEEQTERMMAQIEWSFNKTQLSKLNSLSEIVSEYNDQKEEIFKRSNEFLDTVNSFLVDSGKGLNFSGAGELVFKLNDELEDRDIRTLSSGEIQLIVILTHLYFNPEVEHANVFIIDEPELSLHVQWQEKFVDGLTSASNKTQFIMATHSPSIILDRVSNCIEIPA